MSLSNNAEDKFLNYMRDITLTPVYTLPYQLALFVADPTEAMTNGAASVLNEVVGNDTAGPGTPTGGYARQGITWGAVSSGSMSNSVEILFPVAVTTNWADGSPLNVTHFGIYEQSATRYGVWKGVFTTAKAILIDDQARIAALALVVTLD